jgi:C_GCAxxG_C_C family probable redox protein
MDVMERMVQLKRQGFYCSQIILLLGMDLLGKSNPDLVRSMNGLVRGLGDSGEICGALTGSACLLGLYAGKGTPEEEENPRLDFMVADLVRWFKAEYIPRYGGILCQEILKGDARGLVTRCPVLVSESFQKVKELLVENGFDLSGLDA